MEYALIYEAFYLDVTQGWMKGHPVRLELTQEGLLANHYSTRSAQ